MPYQRPEITIDSFAERLDHVIGEEGMRPGLIFLDIRRAAEGISKIL